MNQNLQNSYQLENDISLREIFNSLVESKKLIILSILIFVSLSFLYASYSKPVFKSTASIEIGYYKMPDGSIELIEEPSNLISDLKINLFYKSENKNLLDDLKITSLEDRIIKIELESKSSETNKKVLGDFIDHILKKHSRLLNLSKQLKQKGISNEIELIESQKSFLKTKFVEANKIKQHELEVDIQYIDTKIRILNQIIIDESNNLALLASDKQLLIKRAAISPTLEEVIFRYESQILDLENNKVILVSELKNLQGQLDRLENNMYSDELFELDQKQKTLEKKLYDLQLQTSTYSNPIGEFKTDSLKPHVLLITFLGLIIGSIVGVFLVFIKKFINDFKET